MNELWRQTLTEDDTVSYAADENIKLTDFYSRASTLDGWLLWITCGCR